MRIITAIISVASVAVALVGCKTTEANYRAAYEQAVARQDESTGIDNTIYDRIRRQAVTTSRVVNGDTIAVKRERVKVTEPAQGQGLAPAYVVVAQFKQLFNARSLKGRLIEAGYPDAAIIETAEPLYYITVAGGQLDEMHAILDRVADNPPVALKEPYPLLLEPVR